MSQGIHKNCTMDLSCYIWTYLGCQQSCKTNAVCSCTSTWSNHSCAFWGKTYVKSKMEDNMCLTQKLHFVGFFLSSFINFILLWCFIVFIMCRNIITSTLYFVAKGLNIYVLCTVLLLLMFINNSSSTKFLLYNFRAEGN